MESSKPERFQFKPDHPRGVDRYIDYFGDGTTIDAASSIFADLTAGLAAGDGAPADDRQS
jgi:hypothetical protein